MLKFPVSSLATQFHPKRVPYEALVSPQLRFGKFEIGHADYLGHYTVRMACRVKISSLTGGSHQRVVDKQTKMLPGSPRDFFVKARTVHCFGTWGAFWFACRQETKPLEPIQTFINRIFVTQHRS